VIIQTVFKNENGGLRRGWRILLTVLLWFAALYGVIWGAAAVLGALFDGWGLTTSNLPYAPAWAQRIVAWHSGTVYALAYIASSAAGMWAVNRWIPERRHASAKRYSGAMLGAGIAASLTAVALAADCMRMEWPLSEPRFQAAQIGALLLIVLGKVSSEILTKRVLFDGAERRLASYALSCAAFVLLNAGWTGPVAVLNTLLLGVISCSIYERCGLAASAGLHIALTAWMSLVFGFPSLSAAALPVYAIYHVSDAWLTGGTAGPYAGLWMTACFMAVILLIFRKELVPKGK